MKIYLVLAFSLIFIACGGGYQAINPDWKKAPEIMYVLVSEPYVANADDITDDFGTVENFRMWITEYLGTFLSSYTEVNIKQVSDEYFEITAMPIDDELVKIPLPVVELDGLNEVVLSVHPLRFWRYESRCQGGGCIGSKYLNLSVAYSIVRVGDKQILAYGVAHVDDSFTFAMTKGNWENVLDKIAKKIIKKTPLEK